MSGTAVHLLAFGGTKLILGTNEVQFPLTATCSAGDFLDQICVRYPQLAPQKKALRLAVNGEYVGNDHDIRCGDEVALIPPVAGG